MMHEIAYILDTASFEMDEHGNHRIVVDGEASKWVRYDIVSRLTKDGTTYVGFSACYKPDLPVEQVLVLSPVNTYPKG